MFLIKFYFENILISFRLKFFFNKDTQTPLQLAVENGNIEIVKLLLSHYNTDSAKPILKKSTF